MTTISTGQLQSFAAKHTQRGHERRQILLGQAKDGAVGQGQLHPGTALGRRDRQLQELCRAWRHRGSGERSPSPWTWGDGDVSRPKTLRPSGLA